MVRRIHPVTGLLAAAVAALALALAPPSPASARVMYAVTFSGTTTTKLVHRDAFEAPEGCSTEDATALTRFTASARLRSRPAPVPFRAHSSLIFRARLSHPSASATIETSGHWEPKFGGPDPSGRCSFVPHESSQPCSILPAATRAHGVAVSLWIDYRGSELAYAGRRPLVRCDGLGEATEAATLMPRSEETGAYKVKLRRSRFDDLRVGQSIAGRGSVTHHWGDGFHFVGSDTLSYRIRVKRAR